MKQFTFLTTFTIIIGVCFSNLSAQINNDKNFGLSINIDSVFHIPLPSNQKNISNSITLPFQNSNLGNLSIAQQLINFNNNKSAIDNMPILNATNPSDLQMAVNPLKDNNFIYKMPNPLYQSSTTPKK